MWLLYKSWKNNLGWERVYGVWKNFEVVFLNGLEVVFAGYFWNPTVRRYFVSKNFGGKFFFAIADPMLGSCYNMNLNILDRNKEFLIADPIMGSRYNLNLIILDVIDLLVIADPIMGSCYNMNLIILTFYWWPYAWVLAFAGWPHVGVLAFVGPMSGSYCSCPCGYLWETKLSRNGFEGMGVKINVFS